MEQELLQALPLVLLDDLGVALVPRVAVTSAWVSPRVKSAEPWVRGSVPTSIVMSRISSSARPSKRRRS
jgi:hypothetical protein